MTEPDKNVNNQIPDLLAALQRSIEAARQERKERNKRDDITKENEA